MAKLLSRRTGAVSHKTAYQPRLKLDASVQSLESRPSERNGCFLFDQRASPKSELEDTPTTFWLSSHLSWQKNSGDDSESMDVVVLDQ